MVSEDIDSVTITAIVNSELFTEVRHVVTSVMELIFKRSDEDNVDILDDTSTIRYLTKDEIARFKAYLIIIQKHIELMKKYTEAKIKHDACMAASTL